MKKIILALLSLAFTVSLNAQCVSGGTIFATFTNTTNITQPPSFVSGLNYEICTGGQVTDTSGGNATRNYYIGGGELIFKAFKSAYIALKTGAKVTILGGSNLINIIHEPGVTIIGATSSTITACSPIAFPSPNSCGSVGIKEYQTNQLLGIFPNPFMDKATIIMSNESESPLQVFNALGELVYESKIENKKTEINLSKQPSGVYFVKIASIIKKIIKE